MRKEQLYEAIGDIQEKYIQEAHSHSNKKKTYVWVKWSAIAASVVVVVGIGFSILNNRLWNTDLPLTEVINITDATEETAFGTRYVYRIDSGDYSSYFSGKVIDPEKIGDKLGDVTVTAGWITAPDQAPADENLRGEIYQIKGIDPHIAVALWFIDKGDALTTTHYYVILNPEADLSPVEEYVIQDYHPNHPGDE